eukprot:scaffold52528_cov15-Tisochrysis_lutea.AAC.1
MENKSNNFVSLAAKELPAQNTPRKAEEGTQTDMHMTNNESKIVELESKLCGVDDRYKVHVARLEEENNALRVKQERVKQGCIIPRSDKVSLPDCSIKFAFCELFDRAFACGAGEEG